MDHTNHRSEDKIQKLVFHIYKIEHEHELEHGALESPASLLFSSFVAGSLIFMSWFMFSSPDQ